MKLDALTINPAAVENGAWVENLTDCGDLRVRTRGLASLPYRQALQRRLRALPAAERRAGATPATDRMVAEALVEGCLLDWENLTEPDGSTIPFSRERALALLTDPRYRPLFDGCLEAATRVADIQAEGLEAAAKN